MVINKFMFAGSVAAVVLLFKKRILTTEAENSLAHAIETLAGRSWSGETLTDALVVVGKLVEGIVADRSRVPEV